MRPSYESYQQEAAAATLLRLRPSRAAPAPPAPLPLRSEALPAEEHFLPRHFLQAEQGEVAVEEVAVGDSGEELDRLLQEQLARIRGTWSQDLLVGLGPSLSS